MATCWLGAARGDFVKEERPLGVVLVDAVARLKEDQVAGGEVRRGCHCTTRMATAGDVLVRKLPVGVYTAVMLCVPLERALVEMLAVPVVPAPATTV